MGGDTVPCDCDNCVLRLPALGAIRSGGVVVVPGGAIGTTGLCGAAACGFCAKAGLAAATASAAVRMMRFMSGKRIGGGIVPRWRVGAAARFDLAEVFVRPAKEKKH